MTHQHRLMTGIPRAHLLALPSELIIQEILSSIPPPCFIACSQTCKTLHTLVSSSLLLTYFKELFIAGMVNNSRCSYVSFPITKRLEMLRDRERRWLHLDPQWRKAFELSPPQEKKQSYDVVPGYLIFGIATPNLGDSLRSLTLPSDLAEEVVWKEAVGAGQEIFHFVAVLEEHNLIACLTCPDIEVFSNFQVHLINHSAGGYHPSAVSPIISVPACDFQPDEVWSDMAVCGATLAVTMKYGKETSISDDSFGLAFVNRLHIWDWKQGVDKGTLVIEQVKKTEEFGLNGLNFLREDILLTPNAGENSLDIYHIPQFPLHDGPLGTIRLITRFRLPELARKFIDFSIESRLSPFQCSSTPGIVQHISAEKPFTTDPGRSILGVTISLEDDGESCTLFFLVRWQRLLEYCLEVVEELSERDIHTEWHKIYPWDEWGPNNCRLFPVPNLRPFSVTTTGSRWVSLIKVPEQHEHSDEVPYNIEVYDFDETRIKLVSQRAAMRGSAQTFECLEVNPGLRIEVVDATSPSIYPSSKGVFAQEIRTHLPYIRTTYVSGSSDSASPGEDLFCSLVRPDICDWGGIFVDDQRIMGIHLDSEEEHFREIEILYLG